MIPILLAVRISLALMLTAGLVLAAGRGFKTQHLLEEHFAKYGPNFGAITRDQYLHMAQQLRDARPSKTLLEAKRADGSGAKFDRKRGWFVAYEPDGTLKLFFIPKDGFRYFQLQSSDPPSQARR